MMVLPGAVEDEKVGIVGEDGEKVELIAQARQGRVGLCEAHSPPHPVWTNDGRTDCVAFNVARRWGKGKGGAQGPSLAGRRAAPRLALPLSPLHAAAFAQLFQLLTHAPS